MPMSHSAQRGQSQLKAEQAFSINDLANSPEVRLYRLTDVLARVPISRSSWFAGIQVGRYPKGLHLGPRTTVWRSDDIDRMIASLGN